MLALFRFQKLILFLRSRVLLPPAPGSGVFSLRSWLRLLLPILGSLGRFGRGTVQRDLRPVAAVWNEERSEISAFVWYLISCLCWIITWIKWTFQRIKTLGNVQLWAVSRFVFLLRFDLKLWTLWEAQSGRVTLVALTSCQRRDYPISIMQHQSECVMTHAGSSGHCSMCVSSAATIISRECCSVEAKLQVCRSCCVPRCMLGSPGDFGERRNCCMASLQPAAHTGPRVSCSLSQLQILQALSTTKEYRFRIIPFHSLSRSSWKSYKVKFLVS